MTGVTPTPPEAARKPHLLTTHGDERTDDWYWLRDRDDPATIAYLEAENAYQEAMSAHPSRSRRRCSRSSSPASRRRTRRRRSTGAATGTTRKTVEGLQYMIRCRRTGALDADEQVLLDENELAAGKEYFDLAGVPPSAPTTRSLAYGVNFDGSDNTDIRFRDLDRKHGPRRRHPRRHRQRGVGERQPTVFYAARDEALRPAPDLAPPPRRADREGGARVPGGRRALPGRRRAVEERRLLFIATESSLTSECGSSPPTTPTASGQLDRAARRPASSTPSTTTATGS